MKVISSFISRSQRGAAGAGGCSPDSGQLPWHRGHPEAPSSSRGAGVAPGIPAWYRVPAKTQRHRGPQRGDGHHQLLAPTPWHPPVYCPRKQLTGPEGALLGEGVVRGAAQEGSSLEVVAEEREAGWDPVGSAGSGLSAAGAHGANRTCMVSVVPQHPQHLPASRDRVCREQRVPAVPSVPIPAESNLLSSSSALSRGTDADRSLLVGASSGGTLPCAIGLGSLWRGQNHCHHPDRITVTTQTPQCHHSDPPGGAGAVLTAMGHGTDPNHRWLLPPPPTQVPPATYPEGLVSLGDDCRLSLGCLLGRVAGRVVAFPSG